MIKDYAKRSGANKHKQQDKQRLFTPAKLCVTLLVIILLGGFAYWLLSGARHKIAMQQALPPVEQIQSGSDISVTASNIASDNNQSASANETANTSSNANSNSGAQYQFYTLLSQIKVADPNQAGQAAALPGTAPGFWLQLAVYYTEEDAKAMVERLQLLGLAPDITQHVSASTGRILYYVIQGPYPDKKAALAKQQDLQKLKLDSLIYQV